MRRSHDSKTTAIVLSLVTSVFIQLIYLILLTQAADSDFTKNLIPEGYNALSPPEPPEKEPNISLTCHVKIFGFDAFEESSNFFQLQLQTDCRWTDNRINYNYYVEKGINPFIPRSEQKQFWTPYLMFEPIKDGKMYDSPLNYPWLMVNPRDRQTILWTKYSFKVYCVIELHKYPMDTQICQLRFRPFQPEEFNITINPIWGNLTDSDGNPFLDYEVFSFRLTTVKPSLLLRTRPFLAIDFVFERRLSPKIVTLYVPSFIIVAASFVSFWIEPAATPARVALLITNILSLIQLLLFARKELPPVSTVTGMDVWFFFCLIFICAVIAEFVFAYTAYLTGRKRKERQEQRKNQDKESCVETTKQVSPIAWTLVSEKRTSSVNNTFKLVRNKSGDEWRGKYVNHRTLAKSAAAVTSRIKEWIRQEQMDQISKITFPLMLFLFTLLYFISYLS